MPRTGSRRYTFLSQSSEGYGALEERAVGERTLSSQSAAAACILPGSFGAVGEAEG
jgi:hypothetical protein